MGVPWIKIKSTEMLAAGYKMGGGPMSMKIAKRFYWYLCALVLNIVLVILSFKLIHPKNKAAVVAGLGFVFISVFIMALEWRKGQRFKSWSFNLATLFLLIFSIPLLGVRALNFDVEFVNLTVWGMSAPMVHGMANVGYLILLLGVLTDAWKSRLQN